MLLKLMERRNTKEDLVQHKAHMEQAYWSSFIPKPRSHQLGQSLHETLEGTSPTRPYQIQFITEGSSSEIALTNNLMAFRLPLSHLYSLSVKEQYHQCAVYYVCSNYANMFPEKAAVRHKGYRTKTGQYFYTIIAMWSYFTVISCLKTCLKMIGSSYLSNGYLSLG